MKNNKSETYMMDVASVIAMRLTMLPMMWMFNPAKAEKETKKMFSEKDDALKEAQIQLMTAPMTFWFDVWQGMISGDKDSGLGRAQREAEKRISHPYISRVSANRRRLSKGG